MLTTYKHRSTVVGMGYSAFALRVFFHATLVFSIGWLLATQLS